MSAIPEGATGRSKPLSVLLHVIERDVLQDQWPELRRNVAAEELGDGADLPFPMRLGVQCRFSEGKLYTRCVCGPSPELGIPAQRVVIPISCEITSSFVGGADQYRRWYSQPFLTCRGHPVAYKGRNFAVLCAVFWEAATAVPTMEGRVHDEAFVKQLFAEHQALVSPTIPQWLALSDQFNQCGRPAYSVVLIELLEHLRAFKDGYRVMTGIASVCRKVAEQVIIPCFIEIGGQKAELERIPSTERTQHFARLLTAVNLDAALKESILSLRKLCGGAVHEPSSSRLLTILDTVLPRTLALTTRVHRELVEYLHRQGHGGAAPLPVPAPNAPQPVAHNSVPINANDWECPACQNMNFGRRVQCNRCAAPRPAVVLPPHGAPAAPVAAAPAVVHEPPAPVAAHAPAAPAAHQAHAAAQQHGRPLPGDWICESCKNSNFARRDHCHLCGKPRN